MRSFYILLILTILSPSVFGQTLTTGDIWQYKYYHKTVPGFNFMEDGQHYTKIEDGQITKYNIIDGKYSGLIFDGASFVSDDYDGGVNSFKFSKGEEKILIQSGTESIYRRSYVADFYVFDGKKLTPIRPGSKISYATFNPQGSKVAYVFENNLYVYDINSNKTTQLTKDGKQNSIINGSSDWVYEEEFSVVKMFEWAPNGKEIAFVRFDESEVKEFVMPHYQQGMYPDFRTFKYPKVGEKNADVSVHIINLKKGKKTDVQLGNLDDMYVPRIKYTKQGDLIAYVLNRHQNHLKLMKVDCKGKSSLLLEQKDKAYVDVTDDIKFLDKGFVMSSVHSGYNHLYYYDLKGRLKNAITKGDYEVTSFYGVDKKGNVYYQDNKENHLERQIKMTDIKGRSTKSLTKTPGINRAQFSSTFDYYIVTHSDINTAPDYKVYKTPSTFVRNIELNEGMKKHQKMHNVSKVDFFNFKNDSGETLYGYTILPPNYDKNKKYPLFLTGYNGPGAINVKNGWIGNNYWWYQQLAQKGIVVACVDTRGTGGRGEAFKKVTYMQLGKYETEDLISAAKYFGQKRNIDPEKIVVQGWSYGGYMSSLAMLKSDGVIPFAIAVAPVTNWKWYDSVYTERYMRTYKENPEGYDENSPVNFTRNMTDKNRYLLVHGMSDDNVHLQHAAEMMNSLIHFDKQFDSQIYPSRNHGIYGDNARKHLFTKINNFIFEVLEVKND